MAIHRPTHCEICDRRLTGRQSKYCSQKCKAQSHGYSYEQQQARAKRRKAELIKAKGGACSNCGYNRSQCALSFHHRDPSKKSFGLDARRIANRAWKRVLAEAEKCDLLCLNCHAELHFA